MFKQVRWVAFVAGLVIVLTGCTPNEEPTNPTLTPPFPLPSQESISPSPTPPEPQPTSPTQQPSVNAAPQAGTEIPLLEGWPFGQDGPVQDLAMVCVIEGEWLQPNHGEGSNLWYKIVVPKQKLVINDNTSPVVDSLVVTPDGDYYAYISRIWLLPDNDIPRCV